MQAVVRRLRRGDVGLVHDHLEIVGPATLAALGAESPPALHTLHWDPRRAAAFYREFDGRGRVWVNGVSDTQLALAPPELRRVTRRRPAGDAHPLHAAAGAVERGDHLLVLGRICRFKGQNVAARVAAGPASHSSSRGPWPGPARPRRSTS